jgi:hypothetical protein|tara:strand:+ start:27 stop:200 length:174 start_codon:yes stop_codon:yes gene_type:complete
MGSHAERVAMATRLVAKPLLNFDETYDLDTLRKKGSGDPFFLFGFYVRKMNGGRIQV